MDAIARLARRLRIDRRGNAAMVFGLTVPVALAAAGMAIDFGREHAVQNSLQAALDAAVLSAARTQASTTPEIDAAVKGFMAAQTGLKHSASLLTVTGSVSNTAVVKGTAVAKVPTTLMRAIGIESRTLTIKTSVTRTLGRVAVALVFDTTKSMEGSKLDSAKTAAKQLVDKLNSLPNASGNVSVALVPFAQYVNVGTANRFASWIDVPADFNQTSYSCSMTYPNAASSNCRMETVNTTQDGVPFSYQAQVCDWDWGTPVEVCDNVSTTYTWNGCAGSRAHPLNVNDDTYTTRVPGILNAYCPSPIQSLSTSTDDVKTAIDAMTASGDTYIPTGLAWGWRVLSIAEPFAESAQLAAQSNSKLRKFIVLLTDGQNSMSADAATGAHTGTDVAVANQLTAELCTNIRNDTANEIEIFSIAFQVTDPTIKSILQACATPGGAYYDAVDYDQLLSAFDKVGSGMTIARVSH